MLNKKPTVAFGLLVLLLAASCVKDVDLDQANDITLTPVVELDLIYFNLEPADFSDPLTGLPIITLRDTTEIRFLDDPEIAESIVRADFLFRFDNSVERSFEVGFQFISQNNDTTYTTQTMVASGSIEAPVITEFEEVVLDPEIYDLTRANRVVVSVSFPAADPTLAGKLTMQSKTTYYLEIRDRE
jgi:hypothetical protein